MRTPRPATEPRDGPTRNFHEKYRKNTPGAEILDPKKIPRKYRKNTQNGHFRYFGGIFFGIFGRILRVNSGSQNFGPRGIFSVFFVEIPAQAISGLCSRSGCSQILTRLQPDFKRIVRNLVHCLTPLWADPIYPVPIWGFVKGYEAKDLLKGPKPRKHSLRIFSGYF